MIRIALECILVFLLPSAAYFGYIALTAPAQGRTAPRSWPDLMDAAPLGWLFVLGMVLLLATLATFASRDDGAAGKPYVPAILRDGRIQPGEPAK